MLHVLGEPLILMGESTASNWYDTFRGSSFGTRIAVLVMLLVPVFLFHIWCAVSVVSEETRA